MVTPTYPGVYVTEVSSGVRPIQAASTSIPAFIGVAERGRLNEAVKVYNFTEYQKHYGGFLDNSFLSHSVYQFFNNGGSQCYIVRVGGENPETAKVVLKARAEPFKTSLTIAAKTPGTWGNQLGIKIENGTSDPTNEFNLQVYYQQNSTKWTLLERFDNLSMVPNSPNFVTTRTVPSKYVQITVAKNTTPPSAGTSRGAGKPTLSLGKKTKFKIDIDKDGPQEVDISKSSGSSGTEDTNFKDADEAAVASKQQPGN
jgi:phage tail sheath protein FI